LRPTEDDSQPWIVEVQYQTTDKETNQVVDNLQRLTVDPPSLWWVSDSYWEASAGDSYECRVELNHRAHEIIPIVVEQHYRTNNYKAEITTTLRQLSESEIESLKQCVDEQFRRSLWRDSLRWILLLKCLMLGLPAISLLLVLMCHPQMGFCISRRGIMHRIIFVLPVLFAGCNDPPSSLVPPAPITDAILDERFVGEWELESASVTMATHSASEG
jgi:hypothetical protein